MVYTGTLLHATIRTPIVCSTLGPSVHTITFTYQLGRTQLPLHSTDVSPAINHYKAHHGRAGVGAVEWALSGDVEFSPAGRVSAVSAGDWMHLRHMLTAPGSSGLPLHHLVEVMHAAVSPFLCLDTQHSLLQSFLHGDNLIGCPNNGPHSLYRRECNPETHLSPMTQTNTAHPTPFLSNSLSSLNPGENNCWICLGPQQTSIVDYACLYI